MSSYDPGQQLFGPYPKARFPDKAFACSIITEIKVKAPGKQLPI